MKEESTDEQINRESSRKGTEKETMDEWRIHGGADQTENPEIKERKSEKEASEWMRDPQKSRETGNQQETENKQTDRQRDLPRAENGDGGMDRSRQGLTVDEAEEEEEEDKKKASPHN